MCLPVAPPQPSQHPWPARCPSTPHPTHCLGILLPCPALPCPALPCPALPCPALPCPALPCPAPPRPTRTVVGSDDEVDAAVHVDSVQPVHERRDARVHDRQRLVRLKTTKQPTTRVTHPPEVGVGWGLGTLKACRTSLFCILYCRASKLSRDLVGGPNPGRSPGLTEGWICVGAPACPTPPHPSLDCAPPWSAVPRRAPCGRRR